MWIPYKRIYENAFSQIKARQSCFYRKYDAHLFQTELSRELSHDMTNLEFEALQRNFFPSRFCWID